MTEAQATQIAQAALSAPLNTLVAIVAILSVIVVIAIVYGIIKFSPTILKQYQQQLDTNAKLTKIAQQNADQMKSTEEALSGITPELIKQTNAIESQTVEIRTQSLDLRNYQTLVSDGLSNHTAQIEANTASITSLRTAFDALPQQLVAAIQDELACASLIKEVQALRFEVAQVLSQQQAKRVTGTIPAVSAPTEPSPSTP